MLRLAAALLLTAGAPSGAQAQTPVEDLKRHYLDCKRRAQAVRPEAMDAASCSRIYEELKRRAFDGDFRRLHEWYERERTPGAFGAA